MPCAQLVGAKKESLMPCARLARATQEDLFPMPKIARVPLFKYDAFEKFVRANLLDNTNADGYLEAKSMPPCEIKVQIPYDQIPDEPICFQGPHGPLAIPTPEGKSPGDQVSLRLAPEAVYRVDVPKHAQPGDQIHFTPPDGSQAMSVRVPENKKPGEQFEVAPIAVMVQVPEHATDGTTVRFKVRGEAKSFTNAEYATAVVPKGLEPGHYFAVTF